MVLIEHYLDEEIKEEEMGMACGTHGAEEMHTAFW